MRIKKKFLKKRGGLINFPGKIEPKVQKIRFPKNKWENNKLEKLKKGKEPKFPKGVGKKSK